MPMFIFPKTHQFLWDASNGDELKDVLDLLTLADPLENTSSTAFSLLGSLPWILRVAARHTSWKIWSPLADIPCQSLPSPRVNVIVRFLFERLFSIKLPLILALAPTMRPSIQKLVLLEAGFKGSNPCNVIPTFESHPILEIWSFGYALSIEKKRNPPALRQ